VTRFLYHCFLTAWFSLLLAAAVECYLPASLEGIHGLKPSANKEGGLDVLERMEQAVWRRQETLEISEEDLNRYLSSVLVTKVKGVTHDFVKVQHIAVDLEPDLCRLIFVWSAEGHPLTASIDLAIRRERDTFITEVKGGSYGRLKITHRGLMAALVPACSSLGAALDDELHALFQMNKITFLKDKVLLDPRFEPDK
jgi:hypothetical protein